MIEYPLGYERFRRGFWFMGELLGYVSMMAGLLSYCEGAPTMKNPSNIRLDVFLVGFGVDGIRETVFI